MSRFKVTLADANLQNAGKSLDFDFADAMLLSVVLEDGRTIKLHLHADGELDITTFGNLPHLTGHAAQSRFLTKVYPEKPFTCHSCGSAVFDEDAPHCADCN